MSGPLLVVSGGVFDPCSAEVKEAVLSAVDFRVVEWCSGDPFVTVDVDVDDGLPPVTVRGELLWTEFDRTGRAAAVRLAVEWSTAAVDGTRQQVVYRLGVEVE